MSVLAALGPVVLVLPCALPAQEGRVEEEEPAVLTASPEELERLLGRYASARKAKDGEKVIVALARMAKHDNPELLEPALEALRYKASRVDKKAIQASALELGIEGKGDLEELVFLREAKVRGRAARVLANLPGKESEKSLLKALRDKGNRKDRPKAVAGIIDALGRLDIEKASDEVYGEYQAYRDKDVVRACVRYFGQVESRDLKVVRTLCDDLSRPEPANVDSATNPPQSYWEARWAMWDHVRRDVSWALKEITGQVFAPAEGSHPGDALEARRWVEEHAKELGLR